MQTAGKPILISGIQPSGRLHIGNYVGALQNFVRLQNEGSYKTYFFIADLHSLTENYTAEEKIAQIEDLAAAYLAAGLDPERSVILQQSQVAAHCELSWILNTITPIGELERMTQYKDKAARGGMAGANVGLFTYPVLMAADILLYDAKFVPVGEDQVQHLELTRTLARKFNKKFGPTFVEPKPLLTTAPRVMSVSDPAHKMSKSESQGCIFLDDEPHDISRKIKRAVTDSQMGISYDPKSRPGVANLLTIYAAFADETPVESARRFKETNNASFKEELATLLADSLAPFRKEKKDILAHPKKLADILAKGSRDAAVVANAKMDAVRKKVGLSV